MKQTINWKKVPVSFEDSDERNNRDIYVKWKNNHITTEHLEYDSYYDDEGNKVYEVYLRCNPLQPEYYAEIN